MQPLDPTSLPDNDNIPGNHYAYCVRLTGQLFMQTGRMIAYYPAPNGPGIRFEPLTTASVSGFVAAQFSAPLYARDWVVATGQGVYSFEAWVARQGLDRLARHPKPGASPTGTSSSPDTPE